MELKKGYNGPEYYPWYDWAKKYASSYAFLLGNRDGYFGVQEDAFVREMQRRLGIVIDGVFGDRTAAAANYKWKTGDVVPVKPRRKIWIYSAPGSGADYWVGPSFELGKLCTQHLNLNHQPVSFVKGGYLGLLGGDSKASYNEVIWDECKSLDWLLSNNEDVKEAMRFAYAYIVKKGWREDELTDTQLIEIAYHLEFECHLTGYSQSAEGMEEAALWLFGDSGFIHPGDKTKTPSTGKFRIIRHCLKLVINFGNPSTEETGIARDKRPEWLRKKIKNINHPNDFYAIVPQSDRIRPAFYSAIVEAEMELPFFVQVLRIAIPIVISWIPLINMFGPLGQSMASGLAGIDPNGPILSRLFGMAGSSIDQKVTEDLYAILNPTGLLKNIPGLIGLIAALPGLQAHGMYGPVEVGKAFKIVEDFRR